MKDDGQEPDAVFEAGGAAFEAWFTERGVSRLVLPPLEEVAACRERAAVVRIVDRARPWRRERADELARFLEGFLSGEEGATVPAVDIGFLSDFTRSVLEEVRLIPRGGTASYGLIARAVGRPGAARAVGGAVSRNPVPVLVPCHRVVRSDGTPGGWSGAPGWKEWLLDLESG